MCHSRRIGASQRAPAQVEIVDYGVFCAMRGTQGCSLRTYVHLVQHRTSDLILKVEDAAFAAGIILPPESRAVLRPEQLNRNVKTFLYPGDAAREHGVRPLLRDTFEKIGTTGGDSLVQPGRLQISGLRQDGGKVGYEAVRKVLLVRVAGKGGHQDQWLLHRNRASLREPVRGHSACKHATPDEKVNGTKP